MPIFDRNGREVIRILDNQGREIETVYDQNGVIVYTNAVTIVGTSPMQFKALGLPLKDYRIYGETLQDGTPSPDMPVDVVGCGVRTENLWDEDYTGINEYAIYRPLFVGDGVFTLSTDFESYESSVYGRITDIFLLSGNASDGISSSTNGAYQGKNVTARSVDGYITIAYRASARTGSDSLPYCKTMLSAGSIALPYEPYGYKLPVTTTNGTDTVTTPIYIGSEPLHRIGDRADYVDYSSGKIMRRIKKLVLTGEETWTAGNANYYCRLPSNGKPYSNALCTHGENSASVDNNGNYLYLKKSTFVFATLADFKSYLAAQYAAGTPVTVWYVLSEPIEEDPPVPFPELPTLSGTNTLTVDTTVKPSRIDLTGRLKTSG